MKVAVAMSGGVDSSVAAALLKQQGFEVIGLTLRLFHEDRGGVSCCGGPLSALKARNSAHAIGIRHYFKSAQELFSKKVIDDFVSVYLSGGTPNPCVECNRHLKFSYLFDLARDLGASALATGHYARIEEADGAPALLRGLDPLKDQSYFLYCLKKEQLGRVLFPLGALTKTEVRALAAGLALPAALEPESRDICFVTEGNYAAWLEKTAGVQARKGEILDQNGKVMGSHSGFFNFTVGQRKGLGVYGAERLYVTEIRPGSNEVVVGPLEQARKSAFTLVSAADGPPKAEQASVSATPRAKTLGGGVNWLVKEPPTGARMRAQIRYRHKPAACVFEKEYNGKLKFVFEEPQFAVAKGQSAVFYDGDRVLGGGIIEDVSK